jgi:hypothetical protein
VDRAKFSLLLVLTIQGNQTVGFFIARMVLLVVGVLYWRMQWLLHVDIVMVVGHSSESMKQ